MMLPWIPSCSRQTPSSTILCGKNWKSVMRCVSRASKRLTATELLPSASSMRACSPCLCNRSRATASLRKRLKLRLWLIDQGLPCLAAAFGASGRFRVGLAFVGSQREELPALSARTDLKVRGAIRIDIGGKEEFVGVVSNRHPRSEEHTSEL